MTRKNGTAPWPFVGDPNGTIPNLPSEEGAALGKELARLFDGRYAETGCDARCDDCAFRLGTMPNQSDGSLMDAMKCIIEGTPFNCHVHERPCAGWVAAMTTREGITE